METYCERCGSFMEGDICKVCSSNEKMTSYQQPQQYISYQQPQQYITYQQPQQLQYSQQQLQCNKGQVGLVSFGKRIYRFSYVVLISLIICIAISFIVYFFNVHYFFRISSIGYMVAVDTKNYNKNDLQYLKSCWDSLGTRYTQYSLYERNQYYNS